MYCSQYKQKTLFSTILTPSKKKEAHKRNETNQSNKQVKKAVAFFIFTLGINFRFLAGVNCATSNKGLGSTLPLERLHELLIETRRLILSFLRFKNWINYQSNRIDLLTHSKNP